MSVERQRVTGDRHGVPTIKDLIRAALDNGKTVRQLEADSGGRVRFQTFQELSNAAPKNFPRDVHETITGMALALAVPETTIVLAYAQGLGIRISATSPFALRVPPGVDGLEPALQGSLLGLMRAVVRAVDNPPQSGTSGQAGKGQEVSVVAPAVDDTQNRPMFDLLGTDPGGEDTRMNGAEDSEDGEHFGGQ